MFKILIAEKVSDKCLEVFNSHNLFEVLIKLKMTTEELYNVIVDCDAIIVRSETKVTPQLIKQGKKLKVIARAGIGLDNIDVQTAKELGIHVLNCNESSISVAEHTLGMILALARHIPQAYGSIKDKMWDREKYIGVEIHNKTLGIIGLGKIGSEVAIRAHAFGMHILVYDPYCTEARAKELFATPVSLDYLLRNADFITVHVPKNKETTDLISFAEFALCKKNARMINMSRGGIVNEKALIHALKEGLISGAALDVFENEPFIDENLLNYPQLIFTPHIAGSTEDAQSKIATSLAMNVIHTLTGFAGSPLAAR